MVVMEIDTSHKSLCRYFHHIFVWMTELVSLVLMKTLLLLDSLADKIEKDTSQSDL